MKKAINWLVGILLLVALIICGLQFYLLKQHNAPECILVTDTVVIKQDSIIEKTKFITKRDTIVQFIRINDVDTIHDTLKVSIPIEHKTSEFNLKKDSFELKQKIHHSGWNSHIDSIECNYNFNYEVTKPKPKKIGLVWYIGLGVGGGANINVNNRTFDYGPNFGLQGGIGIGGYIK